MRILEGNEIDKEAWDDLASKSPTATVFQTGVFHNLFNSVPGCSSEVIAIENGSEIKALCAISYLKEPGLKSYFSRRAIIYGGPLLKDTDEKEFEMLINALSTKSAGRAIYTEIRNLNSFSDFDSVYKKNGWEYLPYQNFIVDCSDLNRLKERFGANRRRQIRKSLESGVSFKVADSVNDVKQFYNCLSHLYKKKIGKPLLPEMFFTEFYNSGAGVYLLVYFNGEVIGGIMCPVTYRRCLYEFYIFGMDEEYKLQYPSTMATWAALEYANSNDLPFFDFMGAGRIDMDYGVREFKSRFGGNLVEYGRYIKIHNRLLYRTGEEALRLIKKVKR